MQCCVSCRNRVLCVVCQVTLGECKIALVHEKLGEILSFFSFFFVERAHRTCHNFLSAPIRKNGIKRNGQVYRRDGHPFFLFFILRWETLIFFTKRRPKNKEKNKSAVAVDPCLPCVLSLTLVALAVVQVFGAKILPPFARSKFPRYFGILSNLFRLLLSIHPSIHRARLYPSPLALPPYGNAAAG